MASMAQILFIAGHVFPMVTLAEDPRNGDKPGGNIANVELDRHLGAEAEATSPEASGQVPEVNPYSALDFMDSIQPFYANFSDARATPQPGPDRSPGDGEDVMHCPTPKIKFRSDSDRKSGLLLSWVSVSPDGRGRKYTLRSTDATLNALTTDGSFSSPPFIGANGPSRRLRGGIIGEDDRSRVNLEKVGTYPYRTIGQLEYKFNGKPWICSGALFGPRHVLTAAHCLFDQKSQAWHTDFKFYVGRYDRNTYRGHSSWTTAYVPTGYIDGGFAEDDMAVIILSKNLGREFGWLGFTSWDRIGQPMYTTGYPGDKPAGTMWHIGCKVIRGAFNVPRVLWHDCDSAGGQSGSAMYLQSHHVMATLVGWMGNTNVACDITSDRFLWLRSFL